MEYIAPEEQIVKLELQNSVLLSTSGETVPGTGDADEL